MSAHLQTTGPPAMPSRSLRECARTAATVASEDREWTPRLYHPESAVSMGRARFFTAKHCNALGRIRVQNSETSCPQRDATRFVDLMSHLRLSNNFDATSSFCSLLSPSALGYSGESSAHAIPSTLGSGSMPHGTTCDVLADPPHRAPSFTKAFQLVPRLAALSARDESGGPTPCPAPSSAASLSPRSVTASVSSAAASFESVGTSLSVAAAQTPPAQAKPDGDDADVAATLVSLLPAPFSALPVRRAAVGSLPVRHAAVASLSLAASRDAKVASATSSASTRPSSEPSQCRHIVCKLTDHTGRWHQESRDRLAAHTACWRDYGSNGRCSYCSHRRLLLADMLEQYTPAEKLRAAAAAAAAAPPLEAPAAASPETADATVRKRRRSARIPALADAKEEPPEPFIEATEASPGLPIDSRPPPRSSASTHRSAWVCPHVGCDSAYSDVVACHNHALDHRRDGHRRCWVAHGATRGCAWCTHWAPQLSRAVATASRGGPPEDGGGSGED